MHILTCREYCRIEDDVLEFRIVLSYSCHKIMEILLRTLREELVLGIVMVDTVAEEHSLGICLELSPILTCTVALIVLEDILEGLANVKVVLAVLHPDDVAAVFCSLRKMVYIFLLLKSQRVPSRHLISHYLEVGKLVHEILELAFLGSFTRSLGRFVRT